jgi:subtilisin family serine protease
MKNIFLLLVFFTTSIFAQAPYDKTSVILKEKLSSSADDSKLLIWVFFTDKGNTLTKLNTSPENIVSPLSLKRRAKTLDKSSLVDFSDLQVNNEYISGLQSLGFELNQKSRWFNGVSGYIIKKVYNNILSLPYVKNTDIVCRFKKSPDIKEPNLNLNKNNPVNNPTGVNALNYGPSLTQNQQINIPALHNLGFNGQGVTVCIMDAGVTLLSHQAFSSMHIIATYDFVNHRKYIGDDSGGMGEGSHGTMTLSTIGGYVPSQLIGPAFGANFLVTKTENTSSETPTEEDNWIAAMEWADSIGVDVTSTSLGYLTFDSPYTSYTWQNMDGRTAKITLGALIAARKGIVVVNSAGNEAGTGTPNTLIAPADADSIITVGAVTSGGVRSSFSSYGNTVDHRIKPDVMAMGSGVIVADPYTPAGNSYLSASGTSFSCPLTAGACAVILSYNPKLTNMQIRDALRNTASRHLSPDSLYGWGIINALAASQYFPLTNVFPVKETVPDNFTLYQNYPNPFNPTTRIRYFLPLESNVKIVLFNILGKELKTLFNGNVTSGDHELELSASGLSSGVYFIKLSAGNFQKTIKITLTK